MRGHAVCYVLVRGRPFGRVVDDLDVVDKWYMEYADTVDQGRIHNECVSSSSSLVLTRVAQRPWFMSCSRVNRVPEHVAA